MNENNKNKQIQQKSFQVEIKSFTDDGEFEGLGSVFNVVDSYGDVVVPGAFTKTLAERGDKIALLWQHQSDQPIGVYTNIEETNSGLSVKGKLALKTQQGAEAYELLKMGALSGLSIGFQTVKENVDSKTGIRYLQEIKLYEISLVTFPACEPAQVSSVKELKTVFDDLDEENRVKVLTFINTLKSSPQTVVEPLVIEHSEPAVADTKQSDEPLMHSLEKLIEAIKTK